SCRFSDCCQRRQCALKTQRSLHSSYLRKTFFVKNQLGFIACVQRFPVVRIFAQWIGLPGYVGLAKQIMMVSTLLYLFQNPGVAVAEAIFRPYFYRNQIGVAK